MYCSRDRTIAELIFYRVLQILSRYKSSVSSSRLHYPVADYASALLLQMGVVRMPFQSLCQIYIKSLL